MRCIFNPFYHEISGGIGSCSKVGGYLSYRTHLYGEKLHSYGVTSDQIDI